MSVCSECSKEAECLLEMWEPCRKAIAWERLGPEFRDENYVAKGTTNTWLAQRGEDKIHKKFRPCNYKTGRKFER